MISRFNKEEPLIREKEPSSERVAYGSCTVAQKVDLFHALDCLSEPVKTVSPKSMEQLGQGYGYMLYSSVLHTERELRSLRLYKAADRAIAFADGKRVLTAMDRELLERHEIEPPGRRKYQAGYSYGKYGKSKLWPHDKLAAQGY